MSAIDEINNFIDLALKNRKYLPNTATNYRSPLKWIEPELTEEEKNSLEILKKNLNQIFKLLYSKHSDKLSAASIEVYRRRMSSVISDYEKYGKDPASMANWNRQTISRNINKEKKSVKVQPENAEVEETSLNNESTQTVLLNLSHGRAKIIVPNEVSPEDVKKLKAQLNILANIFDEG